ncbi:MAG: DUF188 domain-containing protein [Treponema sp.]|nr:DUF188 domain-containing protein [Treponema sp.]
MKILVDADSCPRQARELILRFSTRTGVPVIFVANRPIPGITSEGSMEICPAGEGSADNRIMELACPGDMAVTRDIPLAERLVDAGILVLDDRGGIYTAENIRERRSLRDFMVSLAENGLGAERAPSYGKKELKSFAGSFDRELSRLLRKENLAQGKK